DRNRSHWSTSKTPSYTKSVSWQHHRNRVKSQEVRYLYSEYFADDTSLCQMKLTSFSITTFFQKQEIGYQEAGCYDKASCFLSEERF
ncbi:hypothetical protein ABN304_23520, partial [Escherichia coli]|uniref:hypothetical protein n=1 Tax=Escherichia coli TaxID=562 RepID=UPI0032DA88B0